MSADAWILEGLTLPGQLDPIDLVAEPGPTAVIGPSGCGKSSLLHLLAGFQRGAGTVRGTAVAWMPQDHGLWPGISVEQHLRAVCTDATRREHWLRALDLYELRDRVPQRMSVGERARCALARALCTPAPTLLLDEPLSAIDPERSLAYWDAILEHALSERSFLFYAAHDPAQVLRAGGQALCLREGRLDWHGSVNELYRRPPNEALMHRLGAGTWFTETEALDWLGSLHPGCRRPAQLELQACADGPLVLHRADVLGSETRNHVKNIFRDSEKTFWTLGGPPLPPGTRLRIVERA